MKKCATCGALKDESEYYWRDKRIGKRWGTCKDCQREQRRQWYHKNKESHKERIQKRKENAVREAREYVWKYLSTHPCVDCGESDPIVLEFDHIRGKKKREIASLAGQGYSVHAIKDEISKCVVRCANCHRRKTSEERGWFRGK